MYIASATYIWITLLLGKCSKQYGLKLRPRICDLGNSYKDKALFYRNYLTTIAIGALTCACSGNTPAQKLLTPANDVDQANLCEVSVWKAADVASKCKTGQKITFLPDRWGNEQLPIIFAAVNCDLRYSVVSSPGGVTCIYKGLALEKAENEPTQQS